MFRKYPLSTAARSLRANIELHRRILDCKKHAEKERIEARFFENPKQRRYVVLTQSSTFYERLLSDLIQQENDAKLNVCHRKT